MAYKKDEIEKIFNSIIDRIEEGEPVRRILKEKDTPSSKTFFKWLDNDESKVKRYARACELRADAIFDDMFTIADNQEDDVIKTSDGTEVVNHNVIQRSRLRIDTRKWALAKMNPKKYGDKLDITSKDKSINKTPEIRVNTEEEKKQIDKWLNNL